MDCSCVGGTTRAGELLPSTQPTTLVPPISLNASDSSMQLSSATAAPSGDTGPMLHSARVSSLQKLAIGGFPPLPTIEASPVCAPTSSFLSFGETSLPTVEAVSAQDCSPSHSRMSLRVLFPPPTWISTPPTPPQNVRKPPIRDSKQPSRPVSPSTSFPVSTALYVPPIGPANQMRRSLSCPTFVSRSRAISAPTPALTCSQPHYPKVSDDKKAHRRKRSKTVFHIPSDTNDSPTDERMASNVDPKLSRSPDGHRLGTDTSRSNKDAVRIFHALQELLMTEMDYVRDLQILSTVYIQQLPLFEERTSAFARASSFASPPRVNPAGQVGQSLAPAHVMVLSPSSTSVKPIFSHTEIELLARNLKDVLRLHEKFLSAIRSLLSPLGIPGTPGGDQLLRGDPESISTLISAVEAISEKFTSEAPEFAIYQSFCAGHLEALDLLKKAVSQHPSEWGSFEQRCSTAASRIHRSGLDASTDSEPELRRRRTIPALSSEVKTSSHSINGPDRTFDGRQPKLAFCDYLIKPTQRICRYPLLLEQLKPKKSLFGSGDVESAVASAIKAMQDVAASVDEAYHKREVSTKSSLIVSRFVFPPYSPNSHSVKLPYTPLHSLTPSFLSSLGDCLLAGSLDVMYCSPQRSFRDVSSITARYLGAFLYPGGYIILAKVNKGKRYEPQHWFSIADFVVDEDGDDQVMLPYSFRLSSKDVHFELAAACQKERDIWLLAIEDSIRHKPIWLNAPQPSYKGSGRSPSGDPRTHVPNYISTTHASPGGSDTDSSEPSFHMDSLHRKLTLKKGDAASFQDQSRTPSRYSSTTSIKSIFSPVGHDPNTIYINRSLISGRLQIEHDLEDIASRVCLDARKQAILHEEILFPPPPGHYRETWGFSRSSSAISVANLAKGRLSKQESLRVPRRKTRCDSMTAFTSQSESTNFTFSRRGNVKRFSTPLPRLSLMTPIEPVQPSPATTSSLSVGSQLFNPSTAVLIPFPTNSDPISRPSSPLSAGHRKSRSLIRSVRGLFRTDSLPTSSLPPRHPPSGDASMGSSSSLLRRWRDSVSRRRSRSVPHDEPRTSG